MKRLGRYLVGSLLLVGVISPLTARASSTYKENWIATGFIGVIFKANSQLSEAMCTGPNEWYVEGTNPANQEWYRELWRATAYSVTGNMLEDDWGDQPWGGHFVDEVYQTFATRYDNVGTVDLDRLKQDVIPAQAAGQLRDLCKNPSGYIHPDRSAVMRPAGEYGAWITSHYDFGIDNVNRWWTSLGVVTFPTKWEIRGKVITP